MFITALANPSSTEDHTWFCWLIRNLFQATDRKLDSIAKSTNTSNKNPHTPLALQEEANWTHGVYRTLQTTGVAVTFYAHKHAVKLRCILLYGTHLKERWTSHTFAPLFTFLVLFLSFLPQTVGWLIPKIAPTLCLKRHLCKFVPLFI